MITDTQLKAFCEAVDAKIRAEYGPDVETVHHFKPCTFMRGTKTARIVKNMGCSRSVFCFVDLETGNIYKAASWKQPDPKRHIRGNISNGAADVTAYGAVYMYR